MRDDLIGGLKNALERGVPIENAIRSLVSAGYREAEVRDAALTLDSSVFPVNSAQNNLKAGEKMPEDKSLARKPAQLNQSSNILLKRRKSPNILIILLLIILLLSVAAFLASLFFRERIAEIISSIFGG